MPITTLKQREASSSTPFGITPIPDGVISDVDRAMTLGVYWITSAPPPTTDTTGFDVADTRHLGVLFMQVARPLLYDDVQYPVAYDQRHYLPEFTGADAPMTYDDGQCPVLFDGRHYLPLFTGAASPIFYDRGRP